MTRITDNKILRELLWLKHGCFSGLYGDDGEMQCNRCRIDFKRDSAQAIQKRFYNIGMAKMMNREEVENDVSKSG